MSEAEGEADAPDEQAPIGGGEKAPPEPRTRWWLWALRIGGTVGGFSYIAYIVEPAELWNAFGRVSAGAFFAACAITAANLFVGAVRWRLLLAAYGAPKRPSLFFLWRVYFVGFFYNNYVPGGVGGDVVRGVVTRESFGDRGTTASMTVVIVERALGLSGLLLLVSGTYLIHPIEGTGNVLPFSALGLLIAATAIGAVAVGHRVAHRFPDRIGKLLGRLPVIEHPLPFAGALGLSLVTQALVAVTGWLLFDSVTGGAVSLADALVLVPLAMAAAFFPLSVGGAGVREAAFVELSQAALRMSRADALAVSLMIWASQLTIGAIGGVWQLVAPVGGKSEG